MQYVKCRVFFPTWHQKHGSHVNLHVEPAVLTKAAGCTRMRKMQKVCCSKCVVFFFFNTFLCFSESKWQTPSWEQLIKASPMTMARKVVELFASFLHANSTWTHYNNSVLWTMLKNSQIFRLLHHVRTRKPWRPPKFPWRGQCLRCHMAV